MTQDQTRLTGAEAIPLAYALVARVAADHGIRALAIKGVVLAHHGLRDPRVSADIDVMVHPDDGPAMTRAMTGIGWRRPPSSEAPRLLTYHSVDLVNDHWPIGLDLHLAFPGFLAPAGEVFDELWARRISLPQGHQPVFFPDLVGSAAIAALHHLRHRHSPNDQASFEALVLKSEAALDDAARADLRALATRTGATRSLEPYLSRLGITGGAEHPAERTEWHRWNLSTDSTRDDVWALSWQEAGPTGRARLLWQTLFPSEDRLRHLYFHDVSTPMRVLRWRRMTHVAKRLPAVLRRLMNRPAAR